MVDCSLRVNHVKHRILRLWNLCFLKFDLQEWTAAWQSLLWLHACTLQSGLSHNFISCSHSWKNVCDKTMKDAVFTCFRADETDLQSEETTPSCVVLEYNPLKKQNASASKHWSIQMQITCWTTQMTLQLYHVYYLPVHDQVKCVYLRYFTLTFYYTPSPLTLKSPN